MFEFLISHFDLVILSSEISKNAREASLIARLHRALFGEKAVSVLKIRLQRARY